MVVHIGAVGTEMVMVDEIPFPPQITTTKPLALLGHGKYSSHMYLDHNEIN